MELTHASFFSGVGGLDLGLERAGWRTVSFSEIDPYASAVLAERWPGVPNLGDITDLASGGSGERGGEQLRQHADGVRPDGGESRTGGALIGGESAPEDREWGGDRLVASGAATATLWTGGFPCQDLSVAGKRRGMGAGTRSGLAFAFLDLVAVHRPRFVLLENVPGLLSSHGGRDMAALTGALVELGYGVGYRVLDARYFGVPQRRRRVFILGVSPGGRAGAELAAEVLSVGSRCRRHPPTGVEAGEGAAEGAGGSPIGALTRSSASNLGHNGGDEYVAIAPPLVVGSADGNQDTDRLIVSASPDSRGMRAPDGLAGRSHDRDGLADTLRVGGRASGAGDSYDNTPWVAETLNSGGNNGGFRTEPGAHLVAFVKAGRAQSSEDAESWKEGDVMPTLNSFDVGDTRTTAAILGGTEADDPLLPLGLDSHRYRCCGNGVVADVAEWIGAQLIRALESAA